MENSRIESRAFSIGSILRLTCSDAMSKPPIWREKSAAMSQMSSGLPAFSVVGLPDKAVAESRDRVRSALAAIGLAAGCLGVSLGMVAGSALAIVANSLLLCGSA